MYLSRDPVDSVVTSIRVFLRCHDFGCLVTQERIRASSFQTYCSVITRLHVDFGFPKPAQIPTKTVPFPTSYMMSFLKIGLQDTVVRLHNKYTSMCVSQHSLSSSQDQIQTSTTSPTMSTSMKGLNWSSGSSQTVGSSRSYVDVADC